LWEAAQFDGTTQDQSLWGRAFNEAIDRLGMATFPDLPLHFLGPILMHAGIPTYCLGDYFRLLLARRRVDPALDAESFMAWAVAPGRELRLSELDVPARRFLTAGGDYALDVVDRSLDLLDRLAEADPELDGIRLPARVVMAARHEVDQYGLDRVGSSRTHGKPTVRRRQPRVALDPYGTGIMIVLPAVSDAPEGTATWRVTADGDQAIVRSKAHWVGAAEAAPQTTHPLPRPVRTVHVSLVGWDHASELEVIDPGDPILFFSDDGRRLPAVLPLPPDHVWILHPADRDLAATGQLRTIAETPVPFGWEGWRLQFVSLEHVQAVSLSNGRAHVVQGYTRPRLLLGEPIRGVTTPYGSAVYAEPPPLWLPDVADSAVTWHVEIRQAASGLASGPALISREITQAGKNNIWDGIPQPVLGAFDLTVRGPLGRGVRRTIFIAERLAVAFRPTARALTVSGLEAATAELIAPVGAAAEPRRLSFASSDRARMVEYRSGEETEPLVISPPHVDLLCAGAGASSWTAAPVHLVTETMSDVGRLLIRTPGSLIRGDLEVRVGNQQVQSIPPSGQHSAELSGYDLARASETAAHYGRAELVLPWGDSAMPVGFIRPRRLASGVEVDGDRLRIDNCVHADGLVAALYLCRAPWRSPVVLPVQDEGVVELPESLHDPGPLRVVLRVEDPWTTTDWPDWPELSSYRCSGLGVPTGADEEESAVSRFLAGEGALPGNLRRLDRVWKLIRLAGDLVSTGAPANLRALSSAALREQPGAALIALAESGLDSKACVTGLIASGLAAMQPAVPDDMSKAERLWGTVPSAAAILTSKILSRPGVLAADLSAGLIDAAVAQCGEGLAGVLGDSGDLCAHVGRFGPDAERMRVMQPEQVEAMWQAAVVVPQALLDADTRMAAARRMFDRRETSALKGAARNATVIVRGAERLVAASGYYSLGAQISARRHPEGKGGWLALPAVSAALALVARLAARGDEDCQLFEKSWRDCWTDLAGQAPDLAGIDLVLAEVLIAGAERARNQGAIHDQGL
jgi:hypothetical protein